MSFSKGARYSNVQVYVEGVVVNSSAQIEETYKHNIYTLLLYQAANNLKEVIEHTTVLYTLEGKVNEIYSSDLSPRTVRGQISKNHICNGQNKNK